MPPRREHRDPGRQPVVKHVEQPPIQGLTSKGYVYIERAPRPSAPQEPEVDKRSLSVSLSTSPP
jgi:hypothetical protein